MKEKEYSRRRFINQCAGQSAALLGAMLLLNSCGGNKCGGCLIFKGPVYEEDYCTQCVAKT